MKKTTNKKKAAIFLMFLFFFGCLFSSGKAQATESQTAKSSNVTQKVTTKNKNFTVNTVAGINGYAVYDEPSLITVTVTGKEDFLGSIRMVPSSEMGDTIIAYEEMISIAKGETKSVSFTTTLRGGMSKIKISILDKNEKVIYEETDSVTINTSGEGALMGILSDDYSALNYFDGKPAGLDDLEYTVNAMELMTESIPTDKKALSVFEYLLIDNYDTAKLSDEQYAAIKGWVENGGVLILGLGANYQNVLHKFSDEFVSGTIGGLKKKEVLWDITESDSMETGSELTLEQVDCVEFELNGGEEMSICSNDKTAYRKQVGAGSVVVYAYDLGMEPLVSYEEKEAVATLLLNEFYTEIRGQSYYTVDYGMQGADIAKAMNTASKPSAVLFGIVLGIYVVLVGPVLYLILKKMQKREKIWIAIPLVSFAFTGIVYVLGMMYKVDKPVIDTFSIITLNEETKSEKIYTNVTCPKAKKYSFLLNEEYQSPEFNEYDYSYSLFDNNTASKEYDILLKKNTDGNKVVIQNDTNFETSQFILRKNGENDIGTLDTDLHFYIDGFDGTITNHTKYDLKNVVVVFEGYLYQAGDLKMGEQAQIDREKLVETYMDSTFDSLYDMEKIYRDKELMIRYRTDDYMERCYVNKEEYNQGCIWAGIGAYEPDIFSDESGEQYGQGIIYESFTGEYEDFEGSYCPNIESLCVEQEGGYDTSDGMIYDSIVKMTYSFENYRGITQLVNRTYNKQPFAYNTSTSYADVYAYDAETGEYVQIFKDSDTVSGEELKKYLVGDILILKFENTNDNAYMPKIAAKGEK